MSLLITDAGIAAATAAGDLGVSYKIAYISVGTEGYIPTAGQTALKNEVAREPLSRGADMGQGQLHGEAVFAGKDEFEGKELGYHLEDGTLFAVDSRNGEVISIKRKNSVVTEAFELNLSASSVANITVEIMGAPYATEIVAGIAKIATHEQVASGDNDSNFITPLKLAVEVDGASRKLGAIKSNGLIAFSPNVISKSEVIPDNMNATIIGPKITIASGVSVTVGQNSTLTI
ncbi:hypothetical protein PVK64_01965 [Aliivibrio sp. S4TY2]|uniref:phage tail-collar fiber domain-containing protein n=1 Tax=unclassified Aliivibrio TaxID=2645654 RepID=UPI002377D845|nr:MULTISPECIES: phage tail protein [unclassified Aliivibrio]MDD9154958.1 hypothetical protein [Aliivibrio sp. S4TY2]MDD9158679.1 hypothetical protein [Aliivibrio sp. S4TY1]MDD9162961.1 hypothetical protein [Aliivibrio sp. S4MY2]MDD9166678.1 hypothetical protein [Aliivibrio sp. S4MY4]MDD9184038.1 hypothetical protein [Aliivibrio sp. S4MY3]